MVAEQATAVIGLPATELEQVMHGHFHPYLVEDLVSWLTRARSGKLITDN